MYLTNASISALFRRIELFAALSGLFFAHNSLKINCFHHWDGLYLTFDTIYGHLALPAPRRGLRGPGRRCTRGTRPHGMVANNLEADGSTLVKVEIRAVGESELEEMIQLQCMIFRPDGYDRFRGYIHQGESFLGRKWLIGKKIKKELDKPEGISHAKMV